MLIDTRCKQLILDFERVHWKADLNGNMLADIDKSDPMRSPHEFGMRPKAGERADGIMLAMPQGSFHGLSRVSGAMPASIPGLASCDRVIWITTIASVSFKVSAFESTVVASTLSILRVVVSASAVVRILKWKIAIGPFAIGFCPPARRQKYRYGFREVHWRDLPDELARGRSAACHDANRSSYLREPSKIAATEEPKQRKTRTTVYRSGSERRRFGQR